MPLKRVRYPKKGILEKTFLTLDDIAHALSATRYVKYHSTREAARAMGLGSHRSIGLFEQGKMPNATHLQALATYIGLPIIIVPKSPPR